MADYTQIVWDWNGTLLDDTWLCRDIMNGQLRRIGREPISLNDYRRLFDFPVRHFYELIGFDFSDEPYESVARHFIEEYTRRRFECALHQDAPPALQRLADRGHTHSILSAYAKGVLDETIVHYGLRGVFAHVAGLDNHYASGKVEEGRTLLRTLDTDPRAIVLIGDTVHDYEVARTLGIDCILVYRGHNSRERLAACGAPVVPSVAAAAAIVQGSDHA